jgi:hypothetical protein
VRGGGDLPAGERVPGAPHLPHTRQEGQAAPQGQGGRCHVSNLKYKLFNMSEFIRCVIL